MNELTGRAAWVTGGGGGIGAPIVDELRQRGATVRATDCDDAEGLDRCDMRDPEKIDRYACSLFAAHGKLDILVNNAGIQRRKQFVEFTEADFDDIFRRQREGHVLREPGGGAHDDRNRLRRLYHQYLVGQCDACPTGDGALLRIEGSDDPARATSGTS